jgi:DNA-binding GntR family transcriptional regulator
MKRPLTVPIKNPGNTPSLIAAALRSAILQGRLKSGQQLKQDQIAEQFGVSKIPVREAMVQLRAEGLMIFVPNRGFVVSELSPAEIEEIYIMRLALETEALARAIPRLRNADLIRAAGVLDISELEDDRAQWSDLNWEFHATLYQAARLPRLLAAIETLHNNVARYLVIYLGDLSARGASQGEHKKILHACQKREVDRAVRVLKQHLSRASDRLAAFLSDTADDANNEVTS